MQIKRLAQSQSKSNKNINYADNNRMNLSQLIWNKSKNMGFVGSKNKNSRNIEMANSNKNNILLNSYDTKASPRKINNEKLKFTINKKNLLKTTNRLYFMN